MITNEMVFKQLKREWAMLQYASEHYPTLVEELAVRFSACKAFAESLTGKRYIADVDGIREDG